MIYFLLTLGILEKKIYIKKKGRKLCKAEVFGWVESMKLGIVIPRPIS